MWTPDLLQVQDFDFDTPPTHPPDFRRFPDCRVEALEDRTVRLPSSPRSAAYPVGLELPEAVLAADFNGDGVLDLLTVKSYNSGVTVLLGNVDGTFREALHSATGNWPSSPAVGDFNGDGRLDLAVVSSGAVSVLLGNGDGTFGSPAHINIGSYAYSLTVGDFNGDGQLDLGVKSFIDISNNQYDRANVLLGNGYGTFAPPNITELGLRGNGWGTVAADFNGDGRDDFATAASNGTVAVLLANPDNSGHLLPPIYYATGVDTQIDMDPQSVAVGDVNGDGILDLVTMNSRSSSEGAVSVLLGNGAAGVGDGTFQAPQTTLLDFSPTSLAAGDINADGTLDLVVTTIIFVQDGSDSDYGPWGHDEGYVNVLLGRGNGSFAPPLTSVIEDGILTAVATGDFNGDGFLDAAVTELNFSRVSVLINDQSWGQMPARTISINDVTVTEGNTDSVNATFTLTLSSPHDTEVAVHYSTANDSATAGSDYTGTSGDVTFAIGQTSRSVTVAVLGDRLPEATERFFVNLSNPTNATIADGQGVGTILDDEPRISISDVTKLEGNSGTTPFVFTVSLSVAYDELVTVSYATANGTATAGSDYQTASGTLTFAPGESSKTLAVAVNGDRLAEPNETFFVNLSGASTNALIVRGQGVGTIVDDEPRVSISDVTKSEGKRGKTTLFTFTVTLSVAYDQDVTMSFKTVDGTAKTSDKDYKAKSGTLTFKAGETTKTITIEVIGDSKKETDETFYVDLTGLSSNGLFTKNRGVGTILNDD
jgi:hypothetical protein